MFGLNWVDFFIVIAIIAIIVKTLHVGIAAQLGAIAGFFIGLFATGWLFPHLLGFINDRTLLTIVNVNLVLIASSYCGLKGYDLGRKIHLSTGTGKIKYIESSLGIFIGTIAILIFSWMLCATLGRLPFEGLSNSANDALIIQKLNHRLPPVPAIFAKFNKLVDPNATPYNFEKMTKTKIAEFNLKEFQAAASKADNSIVRITSFGCGGVVSGTGFVAGPDLVITNAHIIAGVKRPIIKYKERSYEGVPVLFDQNRDLAALRTKNLNAPYLELQTGGVARGSTLAILGYPGGDYTASPGIVQDNTDILSRNIYDTGVFSKDIFEMQVQISDGSSGSPAVTSDGKVAAVIFARSNKIEAYGFGLTSTGIAKDVNRAQESNRRVSTGVCLAS